MMVDLMKPTLNDVIAWTNITIDKTDPLNPVINSTASGWATTLNWLTDVTLTTPTSWQALTYNWTTWVNTTPAAWWDMLKSENLSWLADYATARTNLWVYSTTEVNTALDLKQNLSLTNLTSTDLNTIVTNWKYCAQSSCTNMPEVWVKTKLIVNVDPSNTDLVMQEAIPTTTLISYIRTSTNWWTTWTAWTRIKATDETKVSKTWDETIAWIKTFSSSPIIPTPTTDMQPATKKYVDDNAWWGGWVTPFRITIPWEIIADTANYQWLFFYNNSWATRTISDVDIAVGKARAWTWRACAVNLYKSSWTRADWINTNAVKLFTTAIDLWTWYTSLNNVPNTTTVESGKWLSLRITSSAWATNKASNLQVVITYS
jgi:hypothetical protein